MASYGGKVDANHGGASVKCSESVDLMELTTMHFLPVRLSEWLDYKKVYCSALCRDFRAHVITPPVEKKTKR